jgi:manganese/zinc/iron transport system ATP- binding protein
MTTAARHEHDHPQPWWPYGGRGHRDPLPNAPAIELRDVTVRYPRTPRQALTEISGILPRGMLAALVGPNGAGKSTLLKTLAGLLRPDRGTIELYGNRVGACHHRAAYLPQRAEIDWRAPVSVADLVLMGRYVHLGWLTPPGRRDREFARDQLRRLRILDLADRPLNELSGGQQQRALLARALAQESSLFLLDEPLNAVDEETRDIVDEVLREQARLGGTTLVATHDLGRLHESFDAAWYLREGRLVHRESFAAPRAASHTIGGLPG